MTGQELLNKLLVRLGKSEVNIDFISAINSVSGIISKRLWLNQSDFLRSDFAATYAASNPLVYLPEGFLGFVERPYINVSGSVSRLSPLPAEADSMFMVEGSPAYYEMRGTSALKLYPTPAAAGTLVGRYYAKPDNVAALSEDLPFEGFFDDIYFDALILVAQQGIFLTVTPVFEQTMAKQVDITISSRAPRKVRWRQLA
jgi:hypothetical protein